MLGGRTSWLKVWWHYLLPRPSPWAQNLVSSTRPHLRTKDDNVRQLKLLLFAKMLGTSAVRGTQSTDAEIVALVGANMSSVQRTGLCQAGGSCVSHPDPGSEPMRQTLALPLRNERSVCQRLQGLLLLLVASLDTRTQSLRALPTACEATSDSRYAFPGSKAFPSLPDIFLIFVTC